MAFLDEPFDASNVDTSAQSYEVVPPGKYNAHIIFSERRVNKSGNGEHFLLELEILNGPQVGRRLYERLNIKNPNPEVVAIARRTLATICKAVGKLQVNDSEELHNIPLVVDVRVRPPKDGYGESNSVRFLAPNTDGQQPQEGGSASVASAAKPTQVPTPSAPAANTGLPWKRSA